MILEISKFKENSSKFNSNKQNRIATYASNKNNLGQINDNFTNSQKSTQIAFSGNLLSASKNIMGNKVIKAAGKVKRIVEESAILIKKTARKLKGNDELPFVEKPITCNISTNAKIDKEGIDRAAEEALAACKRRDSIQQIENSGNSFAKGDVEPSGKLSSQGKDKVNNPTRAHRKHHEDFDNNPDNLDRNTDNKTHFRGNEDAHNKDLDASDGINGTKKIDDLDEASIKGNNLNDGINDIDNLNLESTENLNKADIGTLDTNSFYDFDRAALDEIDPNNFDTLNVGNHDLFFENHSDFISDEHGFGIDGLSNDKFDVDWPQDMGLPDIDIPEFF